MKFLSTLRTTSTTDQDEALQNFFFAIFTQKRRGDVNKYSFLSFSFLTLYSFTEDAALQPCNVFSQYFSKTILYGRGTIFLAIVFDAKEEQKGFFE